MDTRPPDTSPLGTEFPDGPVLSDASVPMGLPNLPQTENELVGNIVNKKRRLEQAASPSPSIASMSSDRDGSTSQGADVSGWLPRISRENQLFVDPPNGEHALDSIDSLWYKELDTANCACHHMLFSGDYKRQKEAIQKVGAHKLTRYTATLAF